MASPQQITANQLNAQSSTGPTTEAGKNASSKNATRHGFTGQNLVISAAEREAYENHCISYLEHYSPANHEETSLVQQFADLDWSLHQIFVQQTNLLALINSVCEQVSAAGDFQAVAAAIAPLHKSLATLSTYETRKRRAADAVKAELAFIFEARKAAVKEAAQHCKVHQAQGKPWTPAEFGFDCSAAEVETYLCRESARLKATSGSN